MKTGSVTVDPQGKSICGGGLYSGNWNKNDWEMYFALAFDTAPAELGTFKGEELTALTSDKINTVSVDTPQRLGAYVKFGVNQDEDVTVKVKLAISFVSVERAKAFLAAEIPSFDYEAVKNAARARWQEVLGAIDLKSGDSALLRRFYTAMYHMNLQPRDRTQDHGFWDDFHTVWDTWKTVFPMYTLLYPDKMGAIIESFIDRAAANGRAGNGIVLADDFSAAKEFLAGQGVNDTDNAIADACLKGVPLKRHTWQDAYRVLLASAERMRTAEYIKNGYATGNAKTVTGCAYTWRFRSAAATQGFAFNDKAVAAVARLFCTDEIRRPDLAARVIDGIIKRFTREDDYPGDEDNGGMSSYYIFLMCGFFPFATTENYYLHGTRLEEVTLHLGNGKTLRITG